MRSLCCRIFFGGKTIIVEGDTEYTAFKYIIAQKPNEYRDVHIIRARGKATIVSLTKIMNQFGSNYAILHDSDTPKTKSNKNNPAWGNNPNILSAIGQKPAASKVRLLASLPNFEQAYFNQEVTEEKPYNALRVLQNDAGKFATVEKLFTALIDYNAELPDNCIEWSDIEELRNKVEEILK